MRNFTVLHALEITNAPAKLKAVAAITVDDHTLAYQVIPRGHHILGRNPAPIGR